MIIYKRKITEEDIANLDKEEQLIYYKTEDFAITINRIEDEYLVRKKRISDYEKIDEKIIKTIDDALDFIEKL